MESLWPAGVFLSSSVSSNEGHSPIGDMSRVGWNWPGNLRRPSLVRTLPLPVSLKMSKGWDRLEADGVVVVVVVSGLAGTERVAVAGLMNTAGAVVVAIDDVVVVDLAGVFVPESDDLISMTVETEIEAEGRPVGEYRSLKTLIWSATFPDWGQIGSGTDFRAAEPRTRSGSISAPNSRPEPRAVKTGRTIFGEETEIKFKNLILWANNNKSDIWGRLILDRVLSSHPAATSLIPSIPKKISKEKLAMLLRLINRSCLRKGDSGLKMLIKSIWFWQVASQHYKKWYRYDLDLKASNRGLIA